MAYVAHGSKLSTQIVEEITDPLTGLDSPSLVALVERIAWIVRLDDAFYLILDQNRFRVQNEQEYESKSVEIARLWIRAALSGRHDSKDHD